MVKTAILTFLMLVCSLVSDQTMKSSAKETPFIARTSYLEKRDTVWVDQESRVIDSTKVRPLYLDSAHLIKRTEFEVLYKNVKGTVYHPVASQTDDTPLITADNSVIDPKRINELRWVALSIDLISRKFTDRQGVRHNWTGKIKLGDTIWVDYDKKGLWKLSKGNIEKYKSLKARYSKIKGMWIVHDLMGTAYAQKDKTTGEYLLDENGNRKIVRINHAIDFLQHPEIGVLDAWDRNLVIAKKSTKEITSNVIYERNEFPKIN